MLQASILQILNQYQPQPAASERISKAPASEAPANETFSDEQVEQVKQVEQELSPSLEELQIEIATAAGLLRPISTEPGQTPVSLPGPTIEELMQIVAKFKAPEETRIIDVFE
jgi:hypothetical protein